jgi:spore coat-associated protein N
MRPHMRLARNDREVVRNPRPQERQTLMSRLHALAGRPKRTLAALATVLVAVGITAASGANFNATSANPNTTFATGTLTIDNSKEGAAIFTSATDMRPGDLPRTSTVDIENAGTLSGNFTLTRGTPVDSDGTNPLSGKLNVKVIDCGTFASGSPTCDASDPVKYTGTLAAMSSAVSLGNWAGGEKHRYEFDVDVDSSAGNVYQGDSSSATFTWNAA